MMGWIALALRRSTDFRGRSRRKEFWAFTAALLVIVVLVFTVIALAVPEGADVKRAADRAVWVMLAVVGLPQTALMARRLHDIGKSGWWMLVFAVPFAGTFVWAMWMATDGQARPNRYGPDPKGRGADHPVFAPPGVRPAAMPRL